MLAWPLPQASSLTYYLILYAEDNVTQHMELLLQGLYKATQDEEEQVVQQVLVCLVLFLKGNSPNVLKRDAYAR